MPQESEARRKQRTRQLKRQQRQPARPQKRTGAPRKAAVPGVVAGIPKGLAAAAAKQKKPKTSPYLSYIRALHGRLNPSLLKRKPSKLKSRR